MLKICGGSICVPLEMTFKQALRTGLFPSEWKKWNIVPIHKKRNKQNIKNHRLVSLFPICGKIFERLISNKIFINFSANNLIPKNQSGFQPGNFCINQLLSIIHKLFTSFYNGLEDRSIFFGILKLLIKSRMKGLFSNLNKISFLINFFTFYPIF